MKNTIKLLGIIALVAVIGFSFAACGSDDDNGGGGKDALDGTTWKHFWEDGSVSAFTFNSPNFKWTVTTNTGEEQTLYSGTYSISDNTLTLSTQSEGEPIVWSITISGNTFIVSQNTYTKQ